MAFRLGLVGLCTSHPESWVPIIRELTAEKLVDMEVVAAWDSGETRPAGFAEGFRQLACSRIFYAVLSLALLALTVLIYEKKRKGHLRRGGKISGNH